MTALRRTRRELSVYRVIAWLLFAALIVTCNEMQRVYGEAAAHDALHEAGGFATQASATGGQANPFAR